MQLTRWNQISNGAGQGEDRSECTELSQKSVPEFTKGQRTCQSFSTLPKFAEWYPANVNSAITRDRRGIHRSKGQLLTQTPVALATGGEDGSARK